MKSISRLRTAVFWLTIVNLCAGIARAQFTFSTNFNGTLSLAKYTGTNPVVTIPGSNDGIIVTTVGFGAFGSLGFLTSVAIPDTIVRLIGGTFAGCANLTNVSLGAGLTSIPDTTFQSCTALPSITVPNNITSIGTYAFDNCWKLTSITLPDELTTVADNAFSYCSSLTNITLPASLASIGNNVFYACPKLTTVHFQGNAPSVGSGVFNRDHSVIVYCNAGTTGWEQFAQATGLTPVLWQAPTQPSISGMGVLSNQFRIFIAGSSNQTVVVMASTNLTAPVWTPLGTNTLAGGFSVFSDPDWRNYTFRFFRLRSP